MSIFSLTRTAVFFYDKIYNVSYNLKLKTQKHYNLEVKNFDILLDYTRRARVALRTFCANDA